MSAAPIDPEDLLARLDRFPRAALCQMPTPIEAMPRLTARLGGPALFVKRDDLTGLAFGGNKLRKLEYLLGEAIARGADCVVTGGVPQSNHVRQTAAACAKLGLDCHAVAMAGRVRKASEAYITSGNVLITHLTGATLHEVAWSGERNAELHALVERLAEADRTAYVVPYGGSNALGAFGAVHCAVELVQQLRAKEMDIAAVVHCSGSGGTQAGLAVGLAALAPEIKLIGFDIDAEPDRVAADVRRIARETAALLGLDGHLDADTIDVRTGYAGLAYGVMARETLEAIQLGATSEALMTDPVYSGKGLAGLIGLVRAGVFSKSDRLLFLHTGGTPGLFAYAPDLTSMAAPA